MDSQNLNQILQDSQKKLEDLTTEVKQTKEDIENTKDIIEAQQDYANKMLDAIKETGDQYQDSKKIFGVEDDRPVGGLYQRYGMTLVPKPRRSLDIFNVRAFTDEDEEKVFFKDLANLRVETEDNKTLNIDKDILMEQEIENKRPYFDSSPPEVFTLIIEATDGEYFSNEEFNAITIDPYLPGSFDILEVKIQEHSKEDKKDLDIHIEKMPSGKIMLERNYRFYRIEFKIKPSELGFGIKKLGLHREELRDSYAIIEYQKNSFIQDVKDNITIYTLKGVHETTMTGEGVELFMGYEEGYLYNQIEPSSPHETRSLPVNSQKLYVRLPIKTTDSFLGIEVKDIYTR